jgi:hypothetical protein
VVADLVGVTSIAAHARNGAICFSVPEPFVAIIDDGEGWQRPPSRRHAFRQPRSASGEHGIDLGRFGLGLKTASLSQCRKVTVASYCDGDLHRKGP